MKKFIKGLIINVTEKVSSIIEKLEEKLVKGVSAIKDNPKKTIILFSIIALPVIIMNKLRMFLPEYQLVIGAYLCLVLGLSKNKKVKEIMSSIIKKIEGKIEGKLAKGKSAIKKFIDNPIESIVVWGIVALPMYISIQLRTFSPAYQVVICALLCLVLWLRKTNKVDIITNLNFSIGKVVGISLILIYFHNFIGNHDSVLVVLDLYNAIATMITMSLFAIISKQIENIEKVHHERAYKGFFRAIIAMALVSVLTGNIVLAVVFSIGVYDVYLHYDNYKCLFFDLPKYLIGILINKLISRN